MDFISFLSIFDQPENNANEKAWYWLPFFIQVYKVKLGIKQFFLLTGENIAYCKEVSGFIGSCNGNPKINRYWNAGFDGLIVVDSFDKE